MKPFTLTCASCNARLAVRNAAALGQVLGCPKCGSMVKIVAPEPVPEVAGSSAVEEDRALWDETVDDSQIFNTSFDDVDAALTDVTVNRTQPGVVDPSSASPWEGMVAPPESLPPDPSWGMSSIRPWRRRALLAAPVLAGFVLVVSVWGLLTSRSRNVEVVDDRTDNGDAHVDPSDGQNEEPDDTEPAIDNEVEPPSEPDGAEESPTEPLPEEGTEEGASSENKEEEKEKKE